MASEADSALLANGGRGDFFFASRCLFPPVQADRILKDGDRVELGGVVLTAHLTPGHTKGCTTWTMEAKEKGKTYHVVFLGGTSILTHQLLDNPNYPQLAQDFARTFEVLKKLPCEVFLAAHGSFFALLEKQKRLSAGDAEAFVDPKGYREFIQEAEKNYRHE